MGSEVSVERPGPSLLDLYREDELRADLDEERAKVLGLTKRLSEAEQQLFASIAQLAEVDEHRRAAFAERDEALAREAAARLRLERVEAVGVHSRAVRLLRRFARSVALARSVVEDGGGS